MNNAYRHQVVDGPPRRAAHPTTTESADHAHHD